MSPGYRRQSSHGHSHAGDGRGLYPATCHECGEPVKMTGQRSLWFDTDAKGVRRSYHADCVPRVSSGAGARP